MNATLMASVENETETPPAPLPVSRLTIEAAVTTEIEKLEQQIFYLRRWLFEQSPPTAAAGDSAPPPHKRQYRRLAPNRFRLD